ncbi:DUF3108 domain-containing protein [Marinobacter sp.]|uniref:DUF3108 domain-containing protein n=1 Tax=Marinobacter sp. TaxID=50741 RepID=UPI0034A07DD3
MKLPSCVYALLLTSSALVMAGAANASVPEKLIPDGQILKKTDPAETPSGKLTALRSRYSASIDKGVAINGSAVRSLEPQSDGTWLYRFDVDSFIADIEESLSFRWENNQVIPLHYRYKLSGFMIRNRERSIEFNQEAQTVSGHFEGDKFRMDLKKNALDPLGYQLQLMLDLKAGRRELTYSVTDEGDYDEHRFAVLGEESLKTALGELNTIKAEKVRDSDSKRETLMWFAPELDYLLVRLVQVESDGTRYEIEIKEADISD